MGTSWLHRTKPVTGTFHWSRKLEEVVVDTPSQKWSLEILTAGGGRGYSEAILLPDDLNAIVGANSLYLGLLEPNEESIHWGTADANDLPANGLFGLRVTVIPHELKAGGSGNGHIDWNESQTKQSTSRREIPTDDP